MTRVLVFGNSGSGKSTYARALAAREGLVHLDLDAIVWEPNQIAVLRSEDSIRVSLEAFVSANRNWVIEDVMATWSRPRHRGPPNLSS